MPQRDPAADARTIAVELLNHWRQYGHLALRFLLAEYLDVDGEDEDLDDLAAELARLADQLQLALDAGTEWSIHYPDGTMDRGRMTEAAARQYADALAAEPVCRWVGPWQPAPEDGTDA